MTTAVAKVEDSGLSQQTKAIYMAMADEKIKDLEDPAIFSALPRMLAEVYLILGHSGGQDDEDGRNMLKVTIAQMLKDEHKDLTMQEVLMAAKMGARGNFDTSEVSFSVRALNHWCKQYKETLKKKAVKEFSERKLPEKAETKALTDQEKIEVLDERFVSWVNQEDKSFVIGCNELFCWCWNFGLFRYDDSVRFKTVQNAIKVVKNRAKSFLKSRAGRGLGKQLLAEIEAIEDFKELKQLPDCVKQECRNLTLVEWFTFLRESQEKPSDFLKQMKDEAA